MEVPHVPCFVAIALQYRLKSGQIQRSYRTMDSAAASKK